MSGAVTMSLATSTIVDFITESMTDPVAATRCGQNRDKIDYDCHLIHIN